MKLQEYIGQTVTLEVVKKTDFGIYLGDATDRVLLPKKEVPAGVGPGCSLEVFLYKDSQDRLIATTRTPKITMGKPALLRVSDVGRIGAFLDWGLVKDLLLPFREQTAKVKKGDDVFVVLYEDKTGRLCATMKVYDKLEQNSPYQKDDEVEGIVYDTSDRFGVYVAVDEKYSARISRQEVYGDLKIGDRITARVARVLEDGKLDLSIRKKAFLQMGEDAEMVLERIREMGGRVPFTDKADAGVIKDAFGLSKNAFKRAVGRLLKEKKIQIQEKGIVLTGGGVA